MIANNSILDGESREELFSWTRSASLPQGQVTRARILLTLDQGERVIDISKAQGVSLKTVHKWRNRFEAEGVNGLLDQARPGRPTVIEPETVERVLELTTTRVPREATHWSGRLMAEYAGTTCGRCSRSGKLPG